MTEPSAHVPSPSTPPDWPKTVKHLGYAASISVLGVLAFLYFTRQPPAPGWAQQQGYAPPGYGPSSYAPPYPYPQQQTPPPPSQIYAQPVPQPPAVPQVQVPALPQAALPSPQQAPQIPGIQPLQGGDAPMGYEIKTAEVSNKLIEGLSGLASVEDLPPGATADRRQTVVMFFDPRCPYCHKAYAALSGKYQVRFVPVSVLGNEQTMFEAVPTIRGFLRASDKVAALRSVMTEQPTGGLDRSPDAKLDLDVRQNLEVFATLAGNLPDKQPAVPLFVVPKASGGVAVVKGWDERSPEVLQALLKG